MRFYQIKSGGGGGGGIIVSIDIGPTRIVRTFNRLGPELDN